MSLPIPAHTSPDLTIHDNWAAFKSHMLATISQHVLSQMSMAQTNLPWLTSSLKRAIHIKDKLYVKAWKTKNVDIWNDYKSERRCTQKALRVAEHDYIDNILLQGLNNIKPFWKYIKARKQDSMGIASLKKNTHLSSDSLTKATILSDQFHSLFTKVDNIQTSLDGDPYPHLPPLAQC